MDAIPTQLPFARDLGVVLFRCRVHRLPYRAQSAAREPGCPCSYAGPHALIPLPPSPRTQEGLGFLSSPLAAHRLQGPSELVVILRADTSQGLLPSGIGFGVKGIRVTFKFPGGMLFLPSLIEPLQQAPASVPLMLLPSGKCFRVLTLGTWISPLGRRDSHRRLAAGVCGASSQPDLSGAFPSQCSSPLPHSHPERALTEGEPRPALLDLEEAAVRPVPAICGV